MNIIKYFLFRFQAVGWHIIQDIILDVVEFISRIGAPIESYTMIMSSLVIIIKIVYVYTNLKDNRT